MSDYGIIDKRDLVKMTGVPASVGVCEPIEGFAERPDFILGCMKEMADELTAARDEAERLRSELETVHEAFGIGNKSRSLSVLMTNIENVKRFAEYLHAVERKFFMVPGEPDEDYPGCEPEDECLVNSWGSTKDRYLKQFEAAILRKQAEAVESFGAEVAEGALDQDGESGIDFAHGDVQTIADTYAQRLRQQADED